MCTTRVPSTVWGWKRALDPLEPELNSLCVLGIESVSFARAVHTLNCWVISPVLRYLFSSNLISKLLLKNIVSKSRNNVSNCVENQILPKKREAENMASGKCGVLSDTFFIVYDTFFINPQPSD